MTTLNEIEQERYYDYRNAVRDGVYFDGIADIVVPLTSEIVGHEHQTGESMRDRGFTRTGCDPGICNV